MVDGFVERTFLSVGPVLYCFATLKSARMDIAMRAAASNLFSCEDTLEP